MILLNVIIIALLVGWWLSTIDIPTAFSSVISAGAMRHNYLIITVTLLFIAGAGAGLLIPIDQTFLSQAPLTTPVTAIIIAVSAFIAVIATYRLSHMVSVCYAVIGAIFGWQIFTCTTIDYTPFASIAAAWFIAPVASFGIGILLYWLYKTTVGRSGIHLFTLSRYLRFGIVFATIILALMIGVNNGALLMTLNGTITPEFDLSLGNYQINNQFILLIISVLTMISATWWKMSAATDTLAHSQFDISTESALVILLSVSTVLAIFSCQPLCGAVGLAATPLSVSQITVGALMGVALIRKRERVQYGKILRGVASIIVTPLISLFTAYFLFSSIDANSLSIKATEFTAGSATNIMIPLLTVVLLCAAVVALIHMRKQNKLKLSAQNMALEHQRRLYDNQKAMSSLEVKTIMIENENLSNRLEIRRRELINIALGISEQKNFLETIHAQLKSIRDIPEAQQKQAQIDHIENLLLQKMSFSQEMESFYAQVEQLHKDFNIRLTQSYPNLTEHERRLITLLRLGFSTKYIASLMSISAKSVEIGRYRLRIKLGIAREQNLITFIKSL